MPSLTIPVPSLTYDQTASGQATLEGMLQVRCGSPTFPDGSTFDAGDLGTAGFLSYRMAAAGSLWEVWNEADRRWQPSGGADGNLQPQPLTFKEGDPAPWQGILAAAGQQDKDGQPRFVTVVPPETYPQYAVRGLFAAKRAGQTFSGLSMVTPPLGFVSMTDAMRAGLGVPSGQKPINATEMTVFLRAADLSLIGSVTIRESGTSAEIVVANRSASGGALAILQLSASGEIRLQPATGQKVVVTGPIEAEQITYQPLGGGGKVTL